MPRAACGLAERGSRHRHLSPTRATPAVPVAATCRPREPHPILCGSRARHLSPTGATPAVPVAASCRPQEPHSNPCGSRRRHLSPARAAPLPLRFPSPPPVARESRTPASAVPVTATCRPREPHPILCGSRHRHLSPARAALQPLRFPSPPPGARESRTSAPAVPVAATCRPREPHPSLCGSRDRHLTPTRAALEPLRFPSPPAVAQGSRTSALRFPTPPPVARESRTSAPAVSVAAICRPREPTSALRRPSPPPATTGAAPAVPVTATWRPREPHPCLCGSRRRQLSPAGASLEPLRFPSPPPVAHGSRPGARHLAPARAAPPSPPPVARERHR